MTTMAHTQSSEEGMTSVLDLFDPYAMVCPKTEQDILALLDEAIAEAARLNEILSEIFEGGI